MFSKICRGWDLKWIWFPGKGILMWSPLPTQLTHDHWCSVFQEDFLLLEHPGEVSFRMLRTLSWSIHTHKTGPQGYMYLKKYLTGFPINILNSYKIQKCDSESHFQPYIWIILTQTSAYPGLMSLALLVTLLLKMCPGGELTMPTLVASSVTGPPPQTSFLHHTLIRDIIIKFWQCSIHSIDCRRKQKWGGKTLFSQRSVKVSYRKGKWLWYKLEY